MATYTTPDQVLDIVQSKIHDGSAAMRAKLLIWFNEACRVAYNARTWDLLVAESTLTVTSGAIAVPTDLYQLISIQIDDYLYKPAMGDSYADSFDTTLTLDPPPSSSTVLMRYIKALDADYPDNTGATLFPVEFKNLLAAITLTKYYEYENDPRLSVQAQVAATEMSQLKALDNRRKAPFTYSPHGYMREVSG